MNAQPLEPRPDTRPVVGADQEAWILQTISKAIRMGIALDRLANKGSDEALLNHGLEGIVQGAANEIALTLSQYLKLSYENIRRPSNPSLAYRIREAAELQKPFSSPNAAKGF